MSERSLLLLATEPQCLLLQRRLLLLNQNPLRLPLPRLLWKRLRLPLPLRRRRPQHPLRHQLLRLLQRPLPLRQRRLQRLLVRCCRRSSAASSPITASMPLAFREQALMVASHALMSKLQSAQAWRRRRLVALLRQLLRLQ